MRVIAVDPGMATGMARWDNGVFTTWEMDQPYWVARQIWDECKDGTVEEVVIEDFQLTSVSRAKTTAGIRVTLELIGAVRFVTQTWSIPLHFQAPADAKSFATNAALKKVGFITPAKPDHRRSAARHMLLRLVRNGTLDGRSLLH